MSEKNIDLNGPEVTTQAGAVEDSSPIVNTEPTENIVDTISVKEVKNLLNEIVEGTSLYRHTITYDGTTIYAISNRSTAYDLASFISDTKNILSVKVYLTDGQQYCDGFMAYTVLGGNAKIRYYSYTDTTLNSITLDDITKFSDTTPTKL